MKSPIIPVAKSYHLVISHLPKPQLTIWLSVVLTKCVKLWG